MEADDGWTLRIAPLDAVGEIELGGNGVVLLDRRHHRRRITQPIHAVSAAPGKQFHLIVERRVVVGLLDSEGLRRSGGFCRNLRAIGTHRDTHRDRKQGKPATARLHDRSSGGDADSVCSQVVFRFLVPMPVRRFRRRLPPIRRLGRHPPPNGRASLTLFRGSCAAPLYVLPRRDGFARGMHFFRKNGRSADCYGCSRRAALPQGRNVGAVQNVVDRQQALGSGMATQGFIVDW